MKKKLTVTVGIPAYNAEKRIKRLLSSLTIQKEINITIKKIIVYSDCGIDKTVEKAREIKDKRIKIISAKKRQGFAHAVDVLMQMSNSNYFILLNDDIYITDPLLIEKMSAPVLNNKSIGLVGGDHIPLSPRNFIEKAITSTFWAYRNAAFKYKSGNNLFTVDGKLVGMTQEYIKAFSFPTNYAEAGNVDVYLYLICLKNKFKYLFSKDAKVYYKNPNRVRDYIKGSQRNNVQKQLMTKLFSKKYIKEFILPWTILLKYSCLEFLKNPIGTLVIFIIGRYIKFMAKKTFNNFQPNWEVITSSK